MLARLGTEKTSARSAGVLVDKCAAVDYFGRSLAPVTARQCVPMIISHFNLMIADGAGKAPKTW